MELLGIDIGGSGIKGARVDVEAGELVTDRHRIPTPQPAKPRAVAEVVAQIARHFEWTGPIGCTVPAVVRHGVVHTAANIDDDWIGTDGSALLSEVTGSRVRLLNDADAAGIAEMRFGAGRKHVSDGVVLILTFGTGIGSALFVDGHLYPNTEFGHLELDGHDAETRAAARLRQDKHLSWSEWIERVDRYLNHIEDLLWPDLIVFGGGISKRSEKFLPKLTLRTPIVAAELRNNAGIVGAAIAAVEGMP